MFAVIKVITRVLKTPVRTIQTKVSINDIKVPSYMRLSEGFASQETQAHTNDFITGMTLHEDFLSVEEENSILAEIEPYLKKMRYEFDHWDDAIHGFRETERLVWNATNEKILDRVRAISFPPGVNQLKHVHILDLDVKGFIKPHIDAIRFCGDTIAGLSLLTDSVMRLTHEKRKFLEADVLLKRRSLYVMRGTARFDYTHELLGNERSVFAGAPVPKDRRISVICRNAPDPENVN